MKKKEVFIAREIKNFICGICKREVQVVLAKPWILETEKSIIHTWDYGHQHKRVFVVDKNEQFPIEDTLDYD